MNNFGSRLPFSSRTSSPPPRGSLARKFFSIQEIHDAPEDENEFLCVFDTNSSDIFSNIPQTSQDPQPLPYNKSSLIKRFLNNGERESLSLIDKSLDWPSPYRARKAITKPKRKEESGSNCWIICFGLLILGMVMILHLLSSTKKSNILYYD